MSEGQAASPLSGRRLVLIATTLAVVIALLPLLVVTYPPLQDLPNHLARIAVLRAAPDAPIRSYYLVNWQILPNLATDVILLGLSYAVSLATAAKLLLALTFVLWIAGPMLLHWALYRRVSIIPLFAALAVFNRVLQFGFLNFLFGCGVLVVCLASWIMLTPRPWPTRALAGAAMGLLLFFCHLYVFCIFALAVLVWEFLAPRDAAGRRGPGQRVLVVALVVAPGIIALFLGPAGHAGTGLSYSGWRTVLAFLGDKTNQLLAFVTPGSPLGAIFLGIVLALAAPALVNRDPRPNRRMLLICGALLVLFVALPQHLLSGAHVDHRMLAPLALLLAGSLLLTLTRAQSIALATLFLAILAGETATTAQTWRRGEALYRDFTAVSRDLPAGSRLAYIFIGKSDGQIRGATSVLHYGSYAVIEHGAVIPSLFAHPTQQPIVVRPEFRERHGSLVNPKADTIDAIDWPVIDADFDYVVLAGPKRPAERADLEPISHHGVFQLYRVRR